MIEGRFLIAGGVALALSACGGGQKAEEKPASAPTEEAAPVAVPAPAENVVNAAAAPETASAAPAAFAQCAVCHTATKGGANGIGPNLWGTAGSAAAQKAGFAYSPALKAASLHWDDATLDKWLQKPQALVPGTRMTFAGLPDAGVRKQIISYLNTLK
ncbi:c-type cytochrome [Sphingomonas sp. CJ20]